MARVLMMTDFSESYANKLLSGIMRYSHEHEPWTVCKVPPSLRDSGRMQELVDFATRQSTDAYIHQNPYVSKVMYYVNANLGSRIKVESLVDLVPMSRRMLETTFARETGISLYQYIIRARVNRMKDLINAGRICQKTIKFPLI